MQSPIANPIMVHNPEGSYPIYVEAGALDRLGMLCRTAGLGGMALVVTDTQVGPLYGARVVTALQAADYPATLATMPAGEAHKTVATVTDLLGAALAAGLDRAGFVVALGGGVVGDTAGLVAVLYMRGVALVQAPTTVLAMADSSIGGKVGVDHPAAKNLIGAFKQPALVVADPTTLATLPADEQRNGLAEILKAGFIAGGPFLAQLEGPELPPVADLLRPAIEVKRQLVEADPYERGPRALLNLGHTFGHAFEQVSGYRRKHGVGVAQGTVVAAHLAARLGLADAVLPARIERLFARAGLPLRWGGLDLPPGITPDMIIAAMAGDKKRLAGRLRFVLPFAPGDVRVVDDVPLDAVRAVLEETQ
jgi:shikimate kinase/3-dehydroquinate synthase